MESDILKDPSCRPIWGSIDRDFYLSRYPDVANEKVDPVWHYAYVGWKELRDPNQWFSTRRYLDAHPDVGALGLNPLTHFLEYGFVEGREVFASEAAAMSSLLHIDDWAIGIVREGMDRLHYASHFPGGAGQDAKSLAVHYLSYGAAMNLNPAPDFDTEFYLAANPDVREHGINPFVHYLTVGREEGRPKSRGEQKARKRKKREREAVEERALAAQEFDAAFYLGAYPDVAKAGADALTHYLDAGWREGRDPNPHFSTENYLEVNSDVQDAGVNPFVHFLAAGRSEGRIGKPPLGFRYDVIKTLKSLDARIAEARSHWRRREPSEASVLAEAFAGLAGRSLFISASHDNFTENFGGVQLVLAREAGRLGALGIAQMHLFPSDAITIADPRVAEMKVGVLLDGRLLGHFAPSVVAAEMTRSAGLIDTRGFAIHSLLGHNPDALADIILAAAPRAGGWYWIHDYSSLCVGYNLMRNDVQFCAAPPLECSACAVCVYGEGRARQVEAHAKLFKRLDLGVVAPSQAALDVWSRARLHTPRETRVLEHAQLVLKQRAPRKKAVRNAAQPLRVAFLGLPVTHKGWPAFRQLLFDFGRDSRYAFFHFGKMPQMGLPQTFEEVVVTPDAPDAMIHALKAAEIDVAVVWSLWSETFCIAAYEALAAGAALITHTDSGNVARLVERTGYGLVLPTDASLYSQFASGAVFDLAQKRPPAASLIFSGMSTDLLQGETA